jgi:hypothetical protein
MSTRSGPGCRVENSPSFKTLLCASQSVSPEFLILGVCRLSSGQIGHASSQLAQWRNMAYAHACAASQSHVRATGVAAYELLPHVAADESAFSFHSKWCVASPSLNRTDKKYLSSLNGARRSSCPVGTYHAANGECLALRIFGVVGSKPPRRARLAMF